MGSKLATLNEPPHTRSSPPVAAVGGDTGVAISHGNSLLVEGPSRRRHSHSRRTGGNSSGSTQQGSLSLTGSRQRQRAASTSDALSRPAGSTDASSSASNHADNILSTQTRVPESSSEDDELDDSEADDDSSSGSDQHRRNQPSDRHHCNRRRHHGQHHDSPFFTTASSNSSASPSASNALPFRIPPSAVTSSMALSRASNRRRLRALIAAHSLPFPIFQVSDFKCPICHKTVPSEDIELHVVVCLTKPRIDYNVDVLTEDKGECIICFDEMFSGDTIARLPCLCIYHKRCIDDWFKVRRACPAHPPDED